MSLKTLVTDGLGRSRCPMRECQEQRCHDRFHKRDPRRKQVLKQTSLVHRRTNNFVVATMIEALPIGAV